jgi:CPA1 family monovalent cation:H+ antiporter
VQEIEIVLALLVVLALLSILARKLAIPYPILMTVGGLALGLVPGVPRIALPPDVIFLLFLPPLLFAAAFFTSTRELWLNVRSISLLALGLVVATAGAVAVVVHALVPGMGWATAFALGAIVSPTDAVAATAIAQRLGLPHRLVAILEGESLVNDATGLVLLSLALGAVSAGTFSPTGAALQFLWVSSAGIAIGLVVGWATVELERRISDPPVGVIVSLLAPFAAWIPAEAIDVSGVLAVVTAGLALGRKAPRILGSDMRVLGSGVWQMLIFILNGLVFILIGLQLPAILDALSTQRSAAELAMLAIPVCTVVILARLAWVFPATYLPRWLIPGLEARDPSPSPRVVVILGWAGMRGVVSLAAALALDDTFPARDLVLFLVFAVIVVTLVGQGLTLPLLIRRLGVGDDGTAAHEELHAREASVDAARERLDGLADEWPGHLELIDQMRARFQHATEHLEHDHEGDEQPMDQEQIEHAAIRQAVIDAQRLAIIDLRDRGVIGDAALRLVERELDLEELRAEG